MRTHTIWAAGASLLLLAGIVCASEAVDGVNGKLDFSTGSMDSHWAENLMASLSLPVCTNVGLQADGLHSQIGGLDFDGGGLHLFWRDPEKGLLGLSGAGINGKYLYGAQSTLEGQYYLDRFTFGAELGGATLQYKNLAPFIDTHPVGVVASPSVSYYPVDNLMVQVSYGYLLDNDFGQLTLEYQTPVRGLTCFGDLAAGDHGYYHALIGLRYYFGKNKSLIRRHREDDPPNILLGLLSAIGTYGAQFNNAERNFNAQYLGAPAGGSFFGGVTSFSLATVPPVLSP